MSRHAGSVAKSRAVVFAAVFLAHPAGAVEIFDYCLDHPDQCALSVHHVTEGWERHLNADRLQTTASTFKVVALVVYAQAVVDGRLDPERTIPREEWARFWIGSDGGALARSWENLDRPDRVTLDQMMRQMIVESDNAAPDWLLNELGTKYFANVVGRYVDGYHDVPESISANFMCLGLSAEEPAIAARVLDEYSGMDALGYQKELRSLFRSLASSERVAEIRELFCATPPWETASPGCVAVIRSTAAQRRDLANGYFVRSNTRTFNRLLAGILDRTLLPAAVQEIVERHLEWQLELPEAAAVLSRVGAKGGSLGVGKVCNYAAYGELRATGERIVASVFLHRIPDELDCSEDLRPFELLEALVLESGFKEELMRRLPPETPRPDLVARLETVKRKTRRSGDRLKGRLRVQNLGTADAVGPFEVWLVASDDSKADRRDETLEKWVLPSLEAGEGRALRFNLKGLADQEGRYLVVRVDRKREVAESDEDNDRPWEIMR